MPSRLLHIYHRLPAPARSVAASLRGITLRRWRYGPETERLVSEALERDYWTDSQWQHWRDERLSRVLERAATQVPYYRRHWSERRRRGDRASWHDLANWPLLDKSELRSNPVDFVAEDCDRRRMFHECTSGTTGKPVQLWFSRYTVRQWYALYEARCRRWYGVSRHDRWAILGGQLVAAAHSRKPPFWVWNAGLNQLYMSSYHLAPDLIPHYLNALKAKRVRYLLGYTSALYALALEIVRRDRRDLAMAVVTTNAEPLMDHQREVISAAFQCPVRETYGMCEIAAAASECPQGKLHSWPSAGVLEVLREGAPVPPGTAGELVCTGLLNADMPLIRYRIGDRVVLDRPDSTCSCGRTLPLVKSIDGRNDDVLYTRDGRQIGRLDPVFKADLPVREAQIVQQSLASVLVRYVPDDGFLDSDAAAIRDRLRERMGPVEVVLERVENLPRAANGKFRAVICNVPVDEINALTAKHACTS